MNPGQRVRIKSAPDRIGVLTDDIQSIAGKRRWLVQFTDGSQRIPERNLELVEEQETLEALIENESYGRAGNLRKALTHARLTGRLADVIYSMEATNTEFLAYQFKPVLNFLDSTSNGILIADEVGLGKTIEAGLIWTELRAREDASRLLVICPAVLRDKWKSELLHRFGVNATICNAEELLDSLQHHEQYRSEGFAIIASLQGLRPPRGWDSDEELKSGAAELARYIQDKSPEGEFIDCLIIDEAHYLRNPESQTHKLAQLIRPACKYSVLLSATPIQLKSEDLFHLLNIIDSENFEFKNAFDDVITANEPLLAIATKLRAGEISADDFVEAINKCLAHPLLKISQQLLSLRNAPPTTDLLQNIDYRIRLANRLERVNLLGSIINRTRKRDVQENRVIRVPEAPVIEMNEIEREFYDSVTNAVRDHCQQYDLFEGFMLTIPQRQMCSSMPAALRAWVKKAGSVSNQKLEDEIIGDSSFDLPNENSTPKTETKPLIQFLASLSNSVASYKQLKQADSKYETFLNLIRKYWRNNPNKKIILFSFYRETLFYLEDRLNEDGIASTLIMGGMGDKREELVSEFRDGNSKNILLSSEVLSEGVDLQFSSALINYDLPWNPMRVEQRIGRIDRIGQKEDRILIWNFFYAESLDDRVYRRLFERLDIFNYALGDMEAILGEKIRHLTFELLSHNLTPKQEEDRIYQTSSAIANTRHQQEELEKEAIGLAAHADYVLNRVSAAKEMRRYIEGNTLLSYAHDFLKQQYPGSNLVKLTDEPLMANIDLSITAKSELAHFIDSDKAVGRSQLAYNSTGKPVLCCFSNKVDFGSKSHEVITQSHPLIRFAASKIKPNDIHQLVALSLAQSVATFAAKGTYFILVKRWSTSGAKTIERLESRAIDIDTRNIISRDDAEKLVNYAQSSGKDWLAAQSMVSPSIISRSYQQLEEELDSEFDEYCDNLKLENDDKINFQISTLSGQVNRQVQAREMAIEKLQIAGNYKMIKLNRRNIEKLLEKKEIRIMELEKRRNISSEPRDVMAGIINVS